MLCCVVWLICTTPLLYPALQGANLINKSFQESAFASTLLEKEKSILNSAEIQKEGIIRSSDSNLNNDTAEGMARLYEARVRTLTLENDNKSVRKITNLMFKDIENFLIYYPICNIKFKNF